MAYKLSILGLTAIAFVGPIILFISAVLLYRRYRSNSQKGLVSLGLDDNGWHAVLRQKSDAAKLSSLKLADVPLVVVEGKRSSSRPASRAGSGVLSTVSQPAKGSAGSTSSSTRRSNSWDESVQQIRMCSVLTPPAAAVHSPESHVLDMPALQKSKQTQQGQGVQQQLGRQGDAAAAGQPPPLFGQGHSVLGIPAAGQSSTQPPSASEGFAAYVAALLTAHTFALGRIALARNSQAGTAAAQQHTAERQPV
jgi:hypothetical protein